MYSLYPPLLTGNDTTKKRQEIKQYFNNTYDIFEKIFEMLRDDSVFYKKSEPTRHPMIFYFGHTATFFINKLFLMNIISNRINPHFESIFAIGVDEMEWDNVDNIQYEWPKVKEVRAYRKKVRELVNHLIDTIEFSLPITQEDPMWIILMGIEHERIHIETSLVLHRQMPIEFIKELPECDILQDTQETITNSLITIHSQHITLGKEKNHHLYGWDNEYGKYEEDIKEFQASKYLVSNKEFMEFVNDGGYTNLDFWDEEGQNFLKRTKATHPPFWVKTDDGFMYRALCKIIPMPLYFPVEVNALEAEAFCRYKSQKDGVNYMLPSEAEYRAIYIQAGLQEFYHLKPEDANQNLHHLSSSPINQHNFNGIYDVVGNVWQWGRTPIFGFEGFEVHPAYDDFSTPTFDDKHALIFGSSWASSGNLIMKHSRYAFRKHFYQNAGFRYVISSNVTKIQNDYEEDVITQCQKDYAQDNTYPYIQKASLYLSSTQKALDFGCKTGRSSFELARYFQYVDGVDISARFLRVGVNLQKEKEIQCKEKTLSLQTFGYERIKHRISFKQADPHNLKPEIQGYDFVVARVKHIDTFLENIKSRLNPNAIIITFEIPTHKEFKILSQEDGYLILQTI